MKITMIPGDGIGKEIAKSTMEVIDATGVDIDWEVVHAGSEVYEEEGEIIPQNVYDSIDKNKIAIKGPTATPIGEGFRSANVHLRKHYNLHANIRPVRSIGKTPSIHDNIDLVLFRENTEDLYAGVEEKISDDEMHSIKIITRPASEKIITDAFEYAKDNGKDKVAVVTKANIMKLTDGMFLEIAREISENYPDIELQEVLVDNMGMQLVMNPNQYQVIVTQNLYGDIISDIMAGLIGGLGLVPGANIGDDYAIFEAVHGSAPDIAGKGLANPTALILSGCMMLDYLEEDEAAKAIRDALEIVLSDESNFTRDLGGDLSTEEFTKRIIDTMEKGVN